MRDVIISCGTEHLLSAYNVASLRFKGYEGMVTIAPKVIKLTLDIFPRCFILFLNRCVYLLAPAVLCCAVLCYAQNDGDPYINSFTFSTFEDLMAFSHSSGRKELLW